MNGSFEFHPEYWKEISASAQELIRMMLVRDPSKRITLDRVLMHHWVKDTQSQENLMGTVQRLRAFNGKRKLRAACMIAVLANGPSITRKRKLQSILSETHHGEINLLQGILMKARESGGPVNVEQFKALFVNSKLSVSVEHIFGLLDIDHSGTLDLKEIDEVVKILSVDDDKSLKVIFDIYDSDKSGYISFDELAHILSKSSSEYEENTAEIAEQLYVIFDKMDTNRDGQISFDEFQTAVKSDPSLEAQLKHFK
jgi:calcium-dependent protein kinase